MTPTVASALYALAIWWASTAVIILLQNLPARTFRWSLAAGHVAFAVSLWLLWRSAGDTSLSGAYAAFTAAIVAWGWQEMTFFMGAITGPRRTGSEPGSSEWRVFRDGVAACLYHELAIIGTALGIWLLTWGGANQAGLWTFLLLWGMRQSAKLNFFLGVLNIGEQFLPAHLGYLRSFMRKRPMNLLMPASITAGTVLTAVLFWRAAQPGLSEGHAAGLAFLAAMSALAVIEHWMMVAPIPFDRLWNWVLRWRRPHLGATLSPSMTIGTPTGRFGSSIKGTAP